MRPPALTTAELRELNRKIKSPTGRRLLWEIHRLRQIALLADRFELSARSDMESIEFYSQDIAADALREALAELPWLEEERARTGARKPLAGNPKRHTHP